MQMRLETLCFLVTERLSCSAQHRTVLVGNIITCEHQDRVLRSPITLGFCLIYIINAGAIERQFVDENSFVTLDIRNTHDTVVTWRSSLGNREGHGHAYISAYRDHLCSRSETYMS